MRREYNQGWKLKVTLTFKLKEKEESRVKETKKK